MGGLQVGAVVPVGEGGAGVDVVVALEVADRAVVVPQLLHVVDASEVAGGVLVRLVCGQQLLLLGVCALPSTQPLDALSLFRTELALSLIHI